MSDEQVPKKVVKAFREAMKAHKQRFRIQGRPLRFYLLNDGHVVEEATLKQLADIRDVTLKVAILQLCRQSITEKEAMVEFGRSMGFTSTPGVAPSRIIIPGHEPRQAVLNAPPARVTILSADGTPIR